MTTLSDTKEASDIKELILLNQRHNLRYERKFTVPNNLRLKTLEMIVKQNSYLFKEIFQERQVNNIYLDTINYNDYFDNVLGVSDRKKIRIRWYGDTFGKIDKPVLEIKIKKGLIGDKWSFPLAPFVLKKGFTHNDLKASFKLSELPIPIMESLKLVTPSLLNSYSRKYYISSNQNYRITIDFDLFYYKINKNHNLFSNLKPIAIDENNVVELKYGLDNDTEAIKVSSQFPFRLNKNSKYVNGVNTIKRFPQ